MSKSDAGSADRLRVLCQRAAKGGPDPCSAMLRAQFGIVEECQASVRAERSALLDRGKVPELNPSYRERWVHLLGAIDVYEVAARRAKPTPPSEWDGDAVFHTLVEQVRVVRLLGAEWNTARESGDERSKDAFARHASANRAYLAGVVAVVPLATDAARKLGIEIASGG